MGIVIYGTSRNTLLQHLHILSTNGVELNESTIQRILGISWMRRKSDGNNVTLSRSWRLALHAASSEGGWPGWWSSYQGYFLGSSSQESFRGSSSRGFSQGSRSRPWLSWFWPQWQHLQKPYVHSFVRSEGSTKPLKYITILLALCLFAHMNSNSSASGGRARSQ